MAHEQLYIENLSSNLQGEERFIATLKSRLRIGYNLIFRPNFNFFN